MPLARETLFTPLFSLPPSSTVVQNAAVSVAITIQLPSGTRATVRRGIWQGSSATSTALNVSSPDVAPSCDPDRFLAEWAVRTYGASIVHENTEMISARHR